MNEWKEGSHWLDWTESDMIRCNRYKDEARQLSWREKAVAQMQQWGDLSWQCPFGEESESFDNYKHRARPTKMDLN